MSNTKLSELANRKGKLLSPWVDKLGDVLKPTSWSLDRLPEYIWLALILDRFGRTDGTERCINILKKIHMFDSNFDSAKMSWLLLSNDNYQKEVFNIITSEIDPSVLAPLTAIVDYEYCPLFYKHFYVSGLDFEKRIEKLEKVTRKFYDPQSHDTTDLRFLVLIPTVLAGHLHIKDGNPAVNALLYYANTSHEEEIMKSYRPIIRAMEGGMDLQTTERSGWVNHFWEKTSQATNCKLFAIGFDNNEQAMNYNDFIEKTKEAINYLNIQYKQNTTTDDAYTVLTGSLTYAFKVFVEVIEHDLGNTLIGRQSCRIIIEILIMMKYLALKECEKPEIWTEYKSYGIGKYKLILMKLREGHGECVQHVSERILDLLVNEQQNEDLTDIDLRYFDDEKIRDKAIKVGEKDLYDIEYDYDSSYAHGLWGAVRESSMLACDNVFHHFRPAADVFLSQELLDVTSDCYRSLKKIILLVNEKYCFPEWYISFLGDFDE